MAGFGWFLLKRCVIFRDVFLSFIMKHTKACPACQHPITAIGFCGQCPRCLVSLRLPVGYVVGAQIILVGLMVLTFITQNGYLVGALLLVCLVFGLETVMLAYVVPRYEIDD